MYSNYILNLYKQYCESNGKEYCKTKILYDNDFLFWISSLKESTKEYISFLEYLYLLNNEKEIIEINKGKYDSLKLDGLTMVSQFAETVNLKNGNILINNNVPIIQLETQLYDASDTNCFITHNPYSDFYISNLDQVHLLGYDICLGVYGKKDDNDKELKLNLINRYENILGDVSVEYETTKDNYFCLLKSNRKICKKIYRK